MTRPFSMNHNELRALRVHLGFTVKEAADEVKVSQRHFRYLETGERIISPELACHFSELNDMRVLLQEGLRDKISNARVKALPYYYSYEDFIENTKCHSTKYWRLYQAAVASLFADKYITKLDDNVTIPKEFVTVWQILQLYYDGGLAGQFEILDAIHDTGLNGNYKHYINNIKLKASNYGQAVIQARELQYQHDKAHKEEFGEDETYNNRPNYVKAIYEVEGDDVYEIPESIKEDR